jgi:glycerol-1-phosphate dehydrogenase [NAD(P)+]
MSNLNIETALTEVTETRNITIDFGAISGVLNIFTQYFENQQAVIIADENTFAVAGDVVYQRFVDAGKTTVDPIIYPGEPSLYASYENVLHLEESLRNINAIPVVIGSGTLNDLTKLSSHLLGRPYMVVATAASMDGYTASGASISKDGFKQTFSCPAPRVVVADLEVISHAPANMTSSGYGDLLGKIVAGADWIITDELAIEPIDKCAWELVQGPLRESTANPERLIQGDPQAFKQLVEGLMMSGLSLQYYKSSRPASGAEHLISHLWEMQETTHGLVSHGLKVGFATIACAALFERILDKDLTKINIEEVTRNFPNRDQVIQSIRNAHPNPVLSGSFIEQSMAKYVNGEALAKRLILISKCWPEMRDRMRAQLMPARQLSEMLAAAGCITQPSGINKSLAQVRDAYFMARQIRSRYTLLDLGAEAGVLESCVDELFAPGGFWSEVKA